MARKPDEKRLPAKAGGKAPAAGPPAADLVLVGKFGAPQGVRGEIRVRSYTQEPMALAGYGEVFDASGARRFRIVSARPLKDAMLAARIEGIDTRDAAEALTNTDLFVPRSRLPRPDDDEFYHADLIGLEARLADGAVYGRVLGVDNFGAGAILQIQRPDGETEMFSFTRMVFPAVDIAAGFLTIAPPDEIETDAGEGQP